MPMLSHSIKFESEPLLHAELQPGPERHYRCVDETIFGAGSGE